ncbi:MAG: DUF4124 domain-containing protein [Halioglobus sp.]
MIRAVTTTAMLLLAISAHGQNAIYKTVDENGNVVFTDAPPANSENAERLEMPRVNTTPAIEFKEPVTSQASEGIVEAEVIDQEIAISRPANEEQIPMGPGNFSVEVKVSPALKEFQALQLFVDGIPYAEPQAGSIWALSNVFRGKHELTAGIMNDKGEILTMSEPVIVFVQRPTIRR